jgi:divalent metal cation (Fe/Co/Zn/Cd) transporter
VTSRASLARYAPLGLLFLIAAAAVGIGIEAAREIRTARPAVAELMDQAPSQDLVTKVSDVVLMEPSEP